MAATIAPPALTPTEAPPVKRELAPKEELEQLEREARRRGMLLDELREIRLIGDCDDQIQERIAEVQKWLTRRPA